MATSKQSNGVEDASNERSAFNPRSPSALADFVMIEGRWKPMLESNCTFEPDMFLRVMHNLIKNPNIMSTHLFRADIFYDSENDHTIIDGPGSNPFSDFTRHMKQEYRPYYIHVPGYKWKRTFVRQLVPRNRQLDEDLVQTCHFYTQQEGPTTKNLILYVPHVQTPEKMPWYHPKVRMVAFFHEWTAPTPNSDPSQNLGTGSVSVHFDLFSDEFIDQRLERTAFQLLAKIHKHGRGQQTGYQKRVHHDQILPQQRSQDTYARLKATYARSLITNWVEDTDPGKHVFEDLGIAAFLIELWADMYDCNATESLSKNRSGSTGAQSKPPFPGFVDIGCGNGLLVNLLIKEGFPGWGFDARQRKTWKTFAPEIEKHVSEMVLVPEILQSPTLEDGNDLVTEAERKASGALNSRQFHDGMFERGTFIVSNHADELTPWTPLLASLNDSPFIAIPCCSHNLAGAKWRAPPSKQAKHKAQQQEHHRASTGEKAADERCNTQAAETGSLKKPVGGKNMPSAYASLCDYVSDLAEEVGFIVEKEVLRIPSTRNICILGRGKDSKDHDSDPREQLDTEMEDLTLAQKRERIQAILARELNAPLDGICKDWVKRADQIAGKKGDGH